MPGPVRDAPLPRTTVPGIPVSLRLATADSPRSSQQDNLDYDQLNTAAERRALNTVSLISRRLDYVEKMSEPNTHLSIMREGLSVLDPTTYDDLREERHSVYNLCCYPPCKNSAPIPYSRSTSSALTKVKLKSNGQLYGLGREEDGAFCSNLCRSRSNWYRAMLGTERTELLEDVEERRREVLRSAKEAVEEPTASSTIVAPPLRQLGDLMIVERETPINPPSAPSFANPDFERPAPARKRPSVAAVSTPSTLTPQILPPEPPSQMSSLLSDLGVPAAARGGTDAVMTDLRFAFEDEDWDEEDDEREEKRRWMAAALEIRDAMRRGEL